MAGISATRPQQAQREAALEGPGVVGTLRGCFEKLGVLFVDALIIRALLLGIYTRALDFRRPPDEEIIMTLFTDKIDKLPREKSWVKSSDSDLHKSEGPDTYHGLP